MLNDNRFQGWSQSMSARWSANFQCVDGLHRGLSVGLLGLLLLGCQSASLRTALDRPAPAPRVSDNAITTPQSHQPEARQSPQPKRDVTKMPVQVESKAFSRSNRESVDLVNWQNEEPPPLVSDESRLSSERPLSEVPAEFDSQEFCVACDLQQALPTLWCDTKELVNWNNALILTVAGGVAIGIRESDLDQRVRDEVAEHPSRWGDGSRILGYIGDVEYQAPVMLGLYGYSVWAQDEELHDLMGSVISASVITGVSTVTLKLITNTDRPSDKFSNGHYGFPSYHTSSTFAIAAVLDEYYGCQVGLPAYALAAAVGFSRIDQQAHDLSDVVFGSVLGVVIGKTVAARHLRGGSRLQVSPYIHPTDGTPGIAWEAKF